MLIATLILVLFYLKRGGGEGIMPQCSKKIDDGSMNKGFPKSK
jgi:hypothetical protein